MRRLLLLGVVLLSLSGNADDKKADERKPSTGEDREHVIAFAREIEADPLSKRATELRGAIVRWIIEVPDLKLTVCNWFPELVDDDKKSKKKHGTELFGQSVVAGAAFLAEYPELQNDLPLVTAAIVDSTLRAYESILREDSNAHWASLDDLLAKRTTGEIPAIVSTMVRSCDAKWTAPAPPEEKEQRRQWMDVLFKRGHKFHDQARYQSALVVYERILETVPDASGVIYEMGNTLQALGNQPKAIEYLDRALGINPKCWHCLMALGNAHDDTGKPQEALNYYRRAIEVAPNEGSPLFNMAVTLERLDRGPEAIVILEKANVVAPQYASPYYSLALLLCKRDQCYRGEQVMRHFLELETTGPRAERAQRHLRPNLSIKSGSLDPKGKELSAFIKYGSVRGDWIIGKHRQKDPEAKSYEATPGEELDALSQQAAEWRESKRANPKLEEPELNRLLKIADAGHLEAFAQLSFCSRHANRCTGDKPESEAIRLLQQWATGNAVTLEPIQQRGVLSWMGRDWP